MLKTAVQQQKTVIWFLGCFVCLVKQDQHDEQNKPDRPNEQDGLAGFFSILLESHRRKQLMWSLNDVMLNSIASQIRIRFKVQLHQDAGTVGADGLDAEGELIGNVRNRASRGDQTEHLVLTIG